MFEEIKEKILVDQDEYIEYKPEKIDDFEWYILQGVKPIDVSIHLPPLTAAILPPFPM